MKAKSTTTILHHGLWLAAILGLLSCGSARAVLYWEALTNNGTAVFEGLEQSPGIIGVASDPLGEFGNVYRYHLTDTYTSGKERCESRGTRTNGVNFRVQYNQAYYIGWRALWTPMPVNPGWVCLFQMHGYGVTGQGAPMTLRCVNNDGFLWAQANANGTNVDFLHMPFKTNVWQTFVVHTFLSTNFTQGYFEVWYNGVLQTNIYGTTRFYGPTWNNVDGNWQDSYNLFKWGCYRSGAMDGKGDGIAYMSDAKIGSTYADVAPGSGGNPDFSLSASPGSLTIIQGNNGTSTITVNPVNGYNGTVSLSASGLPSGVTASFNPSSTTTSSTLTLSASSTAATGTATITITGADGTLTRTTTVALTVNPPSNLPPGWTDADIGSPAIAGYASDSSGTFTVSGSGSDIWGTSDQFNYAYQSVSGDQTVIARLASENGTATYAKAGVMIRETTAADAVEASVLLTPANGVAMQVRPATGAASINMTGWITGVVPPQWVKIVRSGSTFTGYYSADGSTWTQIASTNVTMATSATAGLAVTSHDTASANTATFDNVSISGSSPPPDFSLSASPGSLTIVQGNNGTSTITINPVNGYNGTVSLSASGLPSGVTASFNPSSTTTSSTLTLTASSTAATGTATVTITGTDGTLTHTTTISLTVNPAPDFSITATPSSQTVTAGNGTSYTTTIGSLNGFSGTVSLSVGGLPSNASASFNPASVTGSGNSTLTVNTTTSTPSGTYTLTITGTSGSLTHSTTVSLTVNPAPDFSLSASPTSLTITQGNNGTSTITVNPINGYSGTVSLSVSGLPSGVTASFNPASTTSSSTLTLTASSTATTGTATVTITGTDGTLTHTTTISLTVNPASGLPAGWTDADIGSVGLAGSASYSGGTFTVSGSGSDIWGTVDAFNYAYQSVSGDQTIVARVVSVQNTSSWAKSGIMVRASTSANDTYVAVYVTPGNGVSMQYRNGTGTSAVDLGRQTGLTAPYWVKIVRSGNTFTGYSS
ncbi:MAG: heparin lyase I family protein, partial [Verrucomicrobia bacterium]|nr:heparin lyase I family protein [Verrucomicrobiota bacterium]